MATIFSHPLVPVLMRLGWGRNVVSAPLLGVACIASMLPDIDVLAFRFDIPYASQFGHRGFTHSIAFALALGLMAVPFHTVLKSSKLATFLVLSVSTASHGVLDAMTNGGKGIALFWPITTERFFLPWRPIDVSPIGAHRFFNGGGLDVLMSEMIWLWLPAGLIGICLALYARWRRTKPISGG